MNEKLPPLPEPAFLGLEGDPAGFAKFIYGFTREQVEAIRRDGGDAVCAGVPSKRTSIAEGLWS